MAWCPVPTKSLDVASQYAFSTCVFLKSLTLHTRENTTWSNRCTKTQELENKVREQEIVQNQKKRKRIDSNLGEMSLAPLDEDESDDNGNLPSDSTFVS